MPRWEKALSFTAWGHDQQLIARSPWMRSLELELSWLSSAIKISHSGGDPVQGICRTGNWPLNGFLAKYLPICPSMKCKFCSTRKPSWKVKCSHLAPVQAAKKHWLMSPVADWIAEAWAERSELPYTGQFLSDSPKVGSDNANFY